MAISAGIPGPVSSKTILIRSRSSDETIRIFFRSSGTSSSASRAFVSRLMKTCSSWIGLPCTVSSSGQRSRSTSIARSRSCSCISESARSITSSTSTASNVTGAARPKVRRWEMISVAFRTCSIAFSRSSSALSVDELAHVVSGR